MKSKSEATIDHLAIVVKDLKKSIEHYTKIGFKLEQEIKSKKNSPEVFSAIMILGSIKFVLLETKDKNSPLYKYAEEYGFGVHHIAILINNLESQYKEMKEQGINFSTSIVQQPDYLQVLSDRCNNSGIMMEFIERGIEPKKLNTENFNQLLEELQANEKY